MAAASTTELDTPQPHLSSMYLWSFLALSFLSLIPFWTIKYPVIGDYPNHLARWFVLFHIHDSQFAFQQFYASAWGPSPYVLTDALAVWLQNLLPIDIVGRIILSLCVLSIPVATHLFLRVANPGNQYMALWAFLISFNPNFIMGSLSSELSIALGLVAVTLWLGFCARPNFAKGLLLSLIMSALYLTHLIGFGVAGLVMGIYCLLTEKSVMRLSALAAISSPGIAMFLINRTRSGTNTTLNYHGMTAWEKLRNIVFPLRFFTTPQVILVLVVIAILALFIWKFGTVQWNRPWLFVAAGLLVAYLVAPGEYGLGGYLDVRIIPCLYLFLLAAFQLKKHRLLIAIASLAFALSGIVRVETLFLSQQLELHSLSASFVAIPKDSRVLPVIRLRPERTIDSSAETNHWGYGVIEKGWLVPTLFHIPGVQPLTIVGPYYCPTPLCSVSSVSDTDWNQVAQNYDYLWVDRYPEILPGVKSIAQPIFHNEFVTIYKTIKTN